VPGTGTLADLEAISSTTDDGNDVTVTMDDDGSSVTFKGIGDGSITSIVDLDNSGFLLVVVNP
jgi:hypothetical protein